MAGMHIERSNRTERLLSALVSAVRPPLRDPFAPEWIAVPSAGMERWLSMELSRALGVWANPAFPFPRRLIEDVFQLVLGDAQADPAPWAPSALPLSVCALLGEHAASQHLAIVRGYLDGDSGCRRRMALAVRIADLFDQYATYRPGLVERFRAGEGDDFQAFLFRALVEQHGAGYFSARAAACAARLTGAAALPPLPERIHVFGVSTLPPLYVELLSLLGKHVDVHLYLLRPTRQYMGDLLSRGDIDRALRRGAGARDETLEREHLALEHPLLGSLARHGRELDRILYAHGGDRLDEREDYEEPGRADALHALQSDLLELDREPGARRIVLAEADRSISLHACHGPMREIEVLHDQLVALLEAGECGPSDVVVMTPDIETYAPLVDAVFSSAERPRIPFRVADHGPLAPSSVANALDAALSLLGSRMAASEVLDFVAREPVAARVPLRSGELHKLRELVARSAARWGVDADHRAQVGQPSCDQNTWRFGLRRLLLGYATVVDDDALVLGQAPLPEIDASDAPLLGRFVDFCEQLFALRDELGRPASLAAFCERAERLLAAVTSSRGDFASEHKALRHTLQTLRDDAQRARFLSEIDLAAFRAELRRVHGAQARASGFLGFGVTFCKLVPMRSLPFQVVCMVGMNDGAFPGNDVPVSFDEIAKRPMEGDRSRRDDDRQLFLEALLCARRRLLITYVGQSPRDGTLLAPSVVVTELLDHLADLLRLPEEPADAGDADHARRLVARLTTLHPLSAFSPRYLGADPTSGLFSYDRQACIAARALQQPRRPATPFLAEALPELPAPMELALADLEAFLSSPTRFFLQRRLRVFLPGEEAAEQDREPLSLSALDRFRLGDALLSRGELLPRPASLLDGLRARGELPLGVLGKLAYDDARALAEQLQAKLRQEVRGASLPKVRVELDVGGLVVRGEIGELFEDARASVQYSRIGQHHELRHFLRHLVLSCLRAGGAAVPARTIVVGRPPSARKAAAGVVRWEPVPSPLAVLRSLVELYLSALSSPLPLFASASRAYAEQRAAGKPETTALAAARTQFEGGVFAGDHDDPYVAYAYEGWDAVLSRREPLGFTQAALRVYEPLLAQRSEA